MLTPRPSLKGHTPYEVLQWCRGLQGFLINCRGCKSYSEDAILACPIERKLVRSIVDDPTIRWTPEEVKWERWMKEPKCLHFKE